MQRYQLIQNELTRIDGQSPGTGLGKHIKMCTSPFVFYRGSAQLFYADLAAQCIDLPALDSLPLTTIMGDCHTSNFGFFSEEGSFGERIVFSLNDFDDACIGHGIWDVMRLLVSFPLVLKHCKLVVNGQLQSDKKDYSGKATIQDEQVITAMGVVLDSYQLVLQQGLSRKPADSHFLELNFEDFASPSALQKRYQKASRVVLGGDDFLVKSALAKAIDLNQFPLTFKDDKGKYESLQRDHEMHLRQVLAPYFFSEILDLVGRIGAGTGSVNLNRYYALVGPSEMQSIEDVGKCKVVEVKQQREAAPIYHFPNLHQQNRLNPAHLTVKCQRRMQRRADYILDEAYFDNQHWLVRSRHHAKVGIDPEHIGIGKINTKQGGLAVYASACAQELARAHCRGDRYSLDYEANTLNYLQTHKELLIQTAIAYANQVEDDWQMLCNIESPE